jgi:hypothetical protein
VNRDDWVKASTELHSLMLTTARAQAPVIVRVVELHAPRRTTGRGLPVCFGCDKAHSEVPDPEWPCRTFTVLARDLLDIKSVEDHLERLRPRTAATLSTPSTP